MPLPLLHAIGLNVALASPPGAALDPGDEPSCALLNAFFKVAEMPLSPLSSRECAGLDAGEVVTVVQERSDGNYRAVAFVRTGLSKEAVWLATQDHHYAGEEAIETNLGIQPHRATWYGMLDIPRPFADRHWVIDVYDNVKLARESQDRFWEHPWRKREGAMPQVRQKVAAGKVDRLTLDAFDKALEVPVNEGALIFLTARDGDTLYAYHVTTDIGGGIPDRLVAGWVKSSMRENTVLLLNRAREQIPRHYRRGHTPVLGCGDGAIPFFD